MTFLPPYLRRLVAGRRNLRKIIDNIAWLVLDKILRVGVGLFVGVWVARYLGPQQFGLLNYAVAIVALLGVIATLGLSGIVVRDIVRNPVGTDTTLGTAFVLQLGGALLALMLSIAGVMLLQPRNTLLQILVVILGMNLIFRSSSVISYWFEAQVQSRYTVWVENTAFLLVAAVKVVLIIMEAPLIAFVWAILVEGVLAAIGLLSVYLWQSESVLSWRVSLIRARCLLRDSWPLVLSSIAIMIYMRSDQIMLGRMIGSESVGIYSAALWISEIWYMLPMVIIASLFPTIIRLREHDEALYRKRMQELLDLLVTLAFITAVVVTLSADYLVALLYGSEYESATTVLIFHIWAVPFVFIGVVGAKWYLVEDLQRGNTFRIMAGAVLNVALNWMLIPSYGPVGAAVSTVISQGVAAYLLDGVSRRSIPLFKAKTSALFLGPVRTLGKLRRLA